MSLLIRGARVLDPAGERDEETNVLIEGGRVASIDAADADADAVIDGEGRWLLPGLVDLCARLGEPGFSHRGTIASETAAAAAAGITTLACPPDGRPVLDGSAAAHQLRERIKANARMRVAPIGALSRGLGGEELSDMDSLRRAGCVGVGHGLVPISNARALRKAMQYAASLDLTVFLTPIEGFLADGGLVHEGRTAMRMGLAGIPEAAELAALARDLVIAEDTGARVHFGRLSCARSVDLISQARDQGLPVSADVAMHQLFLTELDIVGFDARCHVVPPLRSQTDRDRLRDAVASGAVDAVCSDHMPLDRDAKLAPLPETEPGISGLETLLSLGLRLIDEGVLDEHALVTRLATRPAEILGLESGRIEVGAPADLVLVDPDAVWTLATTAMHSHGHNTPFEGWEFRGRVERTLVGGQVVYAADEG